jgi:hypothetical protein
MATPVTIVQKPSRSDSTRSVWVEDCRATPSYNGGEPESSEVLSNESDGANAPSIFSGINLHVPFSLRSPDRSQISFVGPQ